MKGDPVLKCDSCAHQLTPNARVQCYTLTRFAKKALSEGLLLFPEFITAVNKNCKRYKQTPIEKGDG